MITTAEVHKSRLYHKNAILLLMSVVGDIHVSFSKPIPFQMYRNLSFSFCTFHDLDSYQSLNLYNEFVFNNLLTINFW